MSKTRGGGSKIARHGWRYLCSVVPLSLILTVMVVVPPVAIAQEAPPPETAGATGATGPSGSTSPLGDPTIASDQADYNPGATVTLTGTDWQGDTTVHINVNDTVGKTWERNVDVSVSPDGTITDTFELPLHFVAVYDVVATGADTDRVATTTFTDSTFDFTQCRNDDSAPANEKDSCEWTNGGINASNSIYTEGDSIPQRWGAQIDTIGPHFVDFQVDFSKASVYAYDFITDPRLTQNSDALLLPCGGIAAFLGATDCGTSYTNAFPLAVDSDPFDAVAQREYPNPRSILVGSPGTLNGIEFTHLGHIPATSCFQDCGDSSYVFRVSFETTVANQKVLIWFGGHVASAFDPDGLGGAIGWGSAGECEGENCGGSSISGSPYHIANETFDGGSIPRKENQVQSAGIEPPGTIVIIKDALPNDAQDFSFTRSGGPGGVFAGTFDLDDDADGTLLNTATFANLQPGSYTVVEDGETGWSLTGLTCQTTVPNGDTTLTTLGTGTAVIDVDFGEIITCTYTNTQQTGSITIVKDAVPNGSTNFTFTDTIPGCTVGPLDDDSDPALLNQVTCTDVPAGQYTVTEGDPAPAFDLTDLDCDDANSTQTGDATALAARQATIDLEAGESVTCTYTNTKRGTITIVKNTVGGNDTFDYDSDPELPSPADADGEFSILTVGGTGQAVFNNVAPGDYDVDELTLPTGWDFTSLTCSDEADLTGGSTVAGDVASISLQAGESVTCTYTNTKRGTIIVEKQTVPDGAPGSFTFTGTAAGTIADNGTIVVSNLVPGTYTSTEADPSAIFFSLTSIVCNDGGSATPSTVSINPDGAGGTATFELDPGETVTCVFTNTKSIHPGTIGFWKNWINHYTSDQFQELIDYLKKNNSTVYGGLTIPLYNAIFTFPSKGLSRDQMILAQLTAVKSNLAVSDPCMALAQKNDDIFLNGSLVDLSPIAGATAYFDSADPSSLGVVTIAEVVAKVEGRWKGNALPTAYTKNYDGFNTFAPLGEEKVIQVLTGINEGALIMDSGDGPINNC